MDIIVALKMISAHQNCTGRFNPEGAFFPELLNFCKERVMAKIPDGVLPASRGEISAIVDAGGLATDPPAGGQVLHR